jgi:tripartite-type tricarboxylate transporter receptor subunit TctC
LAHGGTIDLRQNTLVASVLSVPIARSLNHGIGAVLRRPDTTEHLRNMNMTPVGGTPDEARAFIRDETARWGDVIRAAGITID